ncbi:MAG: FecR domain-containing protein [Candidatus Accumulibacter sp.]|uniref:FecR family protein n=1 Tax=Accumulibacter sp. TaxID=2053492 RepID=UPI0019EA5D8E|nr:FecR family protein [Accumulibacter sp.]MBE2260315.1 FecR domain-containing protein [Paracoccaceae bacterium]MCB1944025.1 FecR domain-containing protein [Accumulibacter sp.]MCP5247092.1 FecR domain-containing protein [Accumulibacter sp.]
MTSGIQREATSGRSPVLHGLLLVLAVALGGCAATSLNVVQEGRLVKGGAIGGVDVIHQGVRSQAKDSMPLQPGDEIETNAQSTAVISFADGARVYVQPATHVRLGSIFVFFGEVLVKVKGYFKVQTEYATAGSEGTEYLVRVEPERRVRVVVAEDRVGLTSNIGRWTRTSLGVGQAASIAGADLVEVGRASPGEVEYIRNRIRELDRLVPKPSNFGTAALVGGLFAIGVGAAASDSRDDHDSGWQSPQQTPPTRVPTTPTPTTPTPATRFPTRIPTTQIPATRFPTTQIPSSSGIDVR